MKLLAANGAVLRVCRTSIKHHVIDTEFNEMFMFRVTEETLKNVTLQVSTVIIIIIMTIYLFFFIFIIIIILIIIPYY